MDTLWTPWRYAYIAGSAKDARPGSPDRPGVPETLSAFPDDRGTVFLNLIGAVRWAVETGVKSTAEAEMAGKIVLQAEQNFVCLNAFPYTSGHVMIVPYQPADSLLKLAPEAATEMMTLAQRMEGVLREVYHPDGINLGMNLGQAAGAGVANHLHMHILPRWYGDTNFMTAVAETRVLPETLEITWTRLRKALGLPIA